MVQEEINIWTFFEEVNKRSYAEKERFLIEEGIDSINGGFDENAIRQKGIECGASEEKINRIINLGRNTYNNKIDNFILDRFIDKGKNLYDEKLRSFMLVFSEREGDLKNFYKIKRNLEGIFGDVSKFHKKNYAIPGNNGYVLSPSSNKAGLMAEHTLCTFGTNLRLASMDGKTPTYEYSTGTSFAAPFVAGMIAVLMEHKGITAMEAKEVLLNTSTPMGDSFVFGRGKMNIEEALN